jgi:hypothetical protein
LADLPKAVAGLAGCMLTRIAVDDAFTFSLHAGGRQSTLRIDGAGTLDGAAFDPDANPASAAPLLSLLHRRIDAAELGDDGALHLAFGGGARLTVLPNEHAVSWAVRGSDGAQASCIAEGKVVWE